MTEHNSLSAIGMAIAELDESGVETLVRKELENGTAPEQIISELSDGIEEVGERYRREEYFLTELIYSSEMFKNAMTVLKPLCKRTADEKLSGVVVMGTVKGDIHDLGKNIVTNLLECAGFSVVDLGVDVPLERFVQAVVSSNAALVGMSMLLTTAFEAAKETIAAIERANLRGRVKIMLGGSVTSENVRRDMGADFWGRDATSAVDIAREVCR